MSELITIHELHNRLANNAPQLPVDVRTEAEFTSAHLPSAVNACVYEVGFLEEISTHYPDKSRAICVYGNAADTCESRMAAEKLDRAGYSHVLELREGIDAWRAAGLPIEGSGEGAGTGVGAAPHGFLPVDLRESRIEWTGRNLLNSHHGVIGLKEGSLEYERGRLAGGKFTIDMNAITCTNLQGDPLHDVLVNHLRSHDFFDTSLYPEARFVITGSKPTERATPGALNLLIHGDLTIKDMRLPIEFSAASGITPEGKVAAQALVEIDRTRWSAIYGSGKFFRNLGMHLVNDMIEIRLRVVTE